MGVMDGSTVLLELYGRVPPLCTAVVDGLDVDALTRRPTLEANPIAWLVWHLTRVQDHHVSELLDREQCYLAGAWAPRFGLDPDPEDTGYGHTAAQVATVRPVSPQVLLDYHQIVDHRTRAYLAGLGAADLDEIVDRRWDPPVTRGVRLVSIAEDSLQHLGQAAYVRGLLGL